MGDGDGSQSGSPDQSQSSADDSGSASTEQDSQVGDSEPGDDDLVGQDVDMLEPEAPNYAVFTEPFSGFTTSQVYDAEREVFFFDAENPAMVSEQSGARASQWLAQGNELGAGGNFGRFMVRLGFEEGEQRAYFTEVEAGTICNLELSADERLSIFATSEPPPTE